MIIIQYTHRYVSTGVAILLSLFLPAIAAAQQKIDPTVEVQKDFDGKMINIHKSKLNTVFNDTLNSFNLNFNYSIFDKPYKDLYEFTPLPSAQIHSPVEEKYPVLLAKIGLSFPLNPAADVYFQPRIKGNNTLQFNASYNGYWGEIPFVAIQPGTFKTTRIKDEKAQADNAVFSAAGAYGYHWDKGELSFALGYSNNYYTYYGFSPLNTLLSPNSIPLYQSIKESGYMRDNYSHRYQQTGAKFHIGSVDAKSKGAKLNYKLDIDYSYTTDKLPGEKGFIKEGLLLNKLNENFIKIRGEIGPAFGRYNKFTVGLNSENAIYTGIQDYKYGLYEIIPQYTFEKERWVINAGIKLSGKYKSKDDTDKYHNLFFVKANISYEITQDNAWIYANIDGGNILNSYSRIVDENKWISQNIDLKATSIPLLIKGGIRGKIYNKLSYDAYVKYTVYEGLLQYIYTTPGDGIPVTHLENQLTAVYSNHKEFTVGAELKWNSKDFVAGTSLEYSSYTYGKKGTGISNQKPYGYTPFKWYLFGTYNWRERIFVGATVHFRAATPVYSQAYPEENTKIRSFFNLGINAKYVINRSFSVFITGENLLNAQIQYYPQYLEKGISFGAGLLVKF